MNPSPGSIIVIHGVGEQPPRQAAAHLAKTLGERLVAESAMAGTGQVVDLGELVSPVEPDVSPDPVPAAFSASSFAIEGLRGGSDGQPSTVALPVYEFHWSNLGHCHQGWKGRLELFWRFLVGLPRFGYQALVVQAEPGMFRVYRLFYLIVWMLLITRLLGGVLVVGLFLGFYRRENWQWNGVYDFFFVVDCLIAIALAVLAIWQIVVLLLPPKVGDRFDVLASCWTALRFLGLAALLAYLIPQAMIEFTGYDSKAEPHQTWLLKRNVQPTEDYAIQLEERGIDPSHGLDVRTELFYYVNFWSGFLPFLGYGLVFVLVALTTLPFVVSNVLALPRAPDRNEAAKQRGQSAMGVFHFFLQLTWTVVTLWFLVVVPLVFAQHVLSVSFGRLPDNIFVFGQAPYSRGPSDQFLGFYVEYIVGMISKVLIGLFTLIALMPRLHQALLPALRLFHDVICYLPGSEVLDRRLKLLTGGLPFFNRTFSGLDAYDDFHRHQIVYLQCLLQHRLRRLIEIAESKHRGPVLLVGHSLGSIIALDTLNGWRPASGRVDLVTMGCPLAMLSKMYPYLYGRSQADLGPGRWDLDALGRWSNYYRGSDPIGREIKPQLRIGGHDSPDNDLLSNGGHNGYFADPLVAKMISRQFFGEWLTPTPTPTPMPTPQQGLDPQTNAPRPDQDGQESDSVKHEAAETKPDFSTESS